MIGDDIDAAELPHEHDNHGGEGLGSRDSFWAKNAANPFPQVAEDIAAELNRYENVHGCQRHTVNHAA